MLCTPRCESFCRVGVRSVVPKSSFSFWPVPVGMGFVCGWRPVYPTAIMDADFSGDLCLLVSLRPFFPIFLSSAPHPLSPVRLPSVLPSLGASVPVLPQKAFLTSIHSELPSSQLPRDGFYLQLSFWTVIVYSFLLFMLVYMCLFCGFKRELFL